MEAEQSKTCCRKALLFGLFFGALAEQNNKIRAEFRSEEIASRAATILQRQFSSAPRVIEVRRAGRVLYEVEATTKAISAFLISLDKAQEGAKLFEIVGFRCAECAHSFMRGVFIALGSVNDPRKGYHLEFSMHSVRRAELFRDLLAKEVAEPKLVRRGAKIGLYYKKNLQISDLLYCLGGVQSGFDFSNVCIERDIRNGENRATNCVARNISRAVEASFKQVEAIELLEHEGRLLNLGEEFYYTARLRKENPSMSLSELAQIHEPPISKSGLNRRLTRIMEEAQSLKK